MPRQRRLGDSGMIGDLLVLGCALSLDNFRTALALGALRLRWLRAAKVAAVFGLWDGIAPLVGVALGHYWSQAIGSTGDYVGPIALGGYGAYLVVRAWRTPAAEELDQRWALFGLPLPLSMDNVLAGTTLGLLGFSPWVAAPVFGVITALLTLVGLQLGRAATHLIRIRPDLLTGVALVVMATVLGPSV
jgi:manganese efflux pump family protein